VSLFLKHDYKCYVIVVHQLTYMTDTFCSAAKESALLDTSADEMIAVMKLTAGQQQEEEKLVKGPSYKKKLAEKKKAKQGGTVATPEPKAQVATEPTKVQAAPEVTKAKAPPAVAETKPAVAQAAPTPPVQQQTSEPATTTSTETSVMAPSPDAPAVPPTDETDDTPEVRRGLRTLMGLLLKHRGGPGFGKGRLKGPEAEGFENLLGEITELLQSEAGSGGAVGVKTAPAQSAVSPPPIQPQQVATPPPVQQAVAIPPQQQQQQQQSPADYVPPATTSTASNAMTYTARGPPDQRLSRTIACVEGAVQMYKNSPPEIQEGLLVPMRGALMAAVNTCNQIIAENELENVKSYQDAVTESPAAAATSSSAPMTPGQFFEVKPYMPGGGEVSGEEAMASETTMVEEEIAIPAVSIGTDENSIFLQTVYDSLEAATGDGKFGLGKLSKEEVSLVCTRSCIACAVRANDLSCEKLTFLTLLYSTGGCIGR